MKIFKINDFSSKCDLYYAWLINHRGRIIDRSGFHRFLLSGRLWIVLVTHATQCSSTGLGIRAASLAGLEKWYLALIQVYEANIFNPNQSKTFALNILPPQVVVKKKITEKEKIVLLEEEEEDQSQEFIELFPKIPNLEPQTFKKLIIDQ